MDEKKIAPDGEGQERNEIVSYCGDAEVRISKTGVSAKVQ